MKNNFDATDPLLDDQNDIELKEKNRRSHRHFKHKGKVRQIDFVLAAKNDLDAQNEKRRKCYFHNLRKKRLKISSHVLSQDEKTKFWHVYAPFDILCDIAEDLNLRLPTKENDIKVTMWYDKALDKLKKWWDSRDPFRVRNSYFQDPKCFFADTFDKSRREEFHNGTHPDKLFSQPERSRLVSYILESTCFEDNKEESIGKSALIELGVLTAAYPCHDGPLLTDYNHQVCTNDRQKLSKEWASFRQIFKYQPLDAIKDYFGVKVAFYYAWIGFYTTYLVPASIIGVLCFFYGALSIIWFEPVNEICSPKNESIYYMCPLCDKYCSYYSLSDFSCLYSKLTHLFDNDSTAFFAVFTSIWSVVYLEYWKRRQWNLTYKWHTMEFYEEEVARPQFSAVAKKLKKNPVTEKMEPCMSKREQVLKVTGAFSVVLFFVALVIGALIGVIVYRAAIFSILLASGGKLQTNSKLFVTATAATINLFVINILKLVYKRLAVMMTEWENPRTRSSYEKSFTLKMFWFQFCNTYASVFYVAFFKSEFFIGWPGHYNRFGSANYRLEGCSTQGCFLELCVQLIILMGGQQLLGNVVEILYPYLKKKYTSWKNEVNNSQDVPVWEADYQLLEQDQLSLFWEYQEVAMCQCYHAHRVTCFKPALQYGFVTMFVAAFPLAPLIALITNVVEIRIDAINMVKSFRRPVAYKSEGIGVWYDILVTVTALGVLVNGFVLSITSEFIPRLVYKYQYSPDGSLAGYIDWSLSKFDVSGFNDIERPDNPTQHVKVTQQFCRYAGFHSPATHNSYDIRHWEIMTIRLIFAFLFQWTVTAASRTLAWIIPDKPRSLDLKMKRQEYLAKEALRKHKELIGKRKPEKEDSASEEENEDVQRNTRGVRSHSRNSRHSDRNSHNGRHSHRNSRNMDRPDEIRHSNTEGDSRDNRNSYVDNKESIDKQQNHMWTLDDPSSFHSVKTPTESRHSAYDLISNNKNESSNDSPIPDIHVTNSTLPRYSGKKSFSPRSSWHGVRKGAEKGTNQYLGQML